MTADWRGWWVRGTAGLCVVGDYGIAGLRGCGAAGLAASCGIAGLRFCGIAGPPGRVACGVLGKDGLQGCGRAEMQGCVTLGQLGCQPAELRAKSYEIQDLQILQQTQAALANDSALPNHPAVLVCRSREHARPQIVASACSGTQNMLSVPARCSYPCRGSLKKKSAYV